MEWGKRTSREEDCGIQALLDEALLGGAQGLPLEPLNLDMHIQKDWGAPERGNQPKVSTAREPHPARFPKRDEEHLSSPNLTTPSHPITGLRAQQPPERTQTPKEAPLPQAVYSRSFKKFAGAVLLWVVVCGLGLLSFTPAKPTAPEALMEDAGAMHSASDYQGALEGYAVFRQNEGELEGSEKARLSFLEAGAAESLWRSGVEGSKNFTLALQRYDEAIAADQTPMRVYASEALMAKAEMNATQALASQPLDASAALIARQSLETLVESPEYSTSPAVALGIAHRRLAELIRAENPQKAIDLLTLSKNRRGGLSEGVEDLLIARIYHEYLLNEDKAYDFYSLVKANPLASEANRAIANAALDGIRGTDLQEPDTLDPRTLDDLPQLRAD